MTVCRCMFADAASQCRRDWQRYGTSCYFVNTAPLTWPDAQTYCESKGGNLASIADSGVNDHVTYLVRDSQKAHLGEAKHGNVRTSGLR